MPSGAHGDGGPQGRLHGAVAIITGAAGGLGAAMAERFGREGAALVLADIATDGAADAEGRAGGLTEPSGDSNLAAAAARAAGAGAHVIARCADVRSAEDMAQLAALAMERFGRIDVVCANAGIASIAPSWEASADEWRNVIDINLTGAWLTARAAIPHMIAAGRGSIIVTSSVAALKNTPNMTAYVASKNGQLGLVRSMANELGQHGIRVNAILPGLVATPMVLNPWYLGKARPDLAEPTRQDLENAARTRNAMRQGMLEPMEIAHAALWLASDESRFVTGVALPVDAGAVIA